MIDESNPKESGLVPAANNALTTRSSALVRRGLESLAARQPRIVRFPSDHSLGQYIIFDRDAVPSVASVSSWFDGSTRSEKKPIEEARGSIVLSPGQVLCVKLNDSASVSD